VAAINASGSTVASAPGNGALIVTNPDASVSLSNSGSSAKDITLNWRNGPSNGGSAIIDYQIFWDQGTGTFAELALASGVLRPHYITSLTLLTGTVYKFKVKERNAFGISGFSNEFAVNFTVASSKPASTLLTLIAVIKKESTLSLATGA
jgi:hypothetical protein